MISTDAALLREALVCFERLLGMDAPGRESELARLSETRPDLHAHVCSLLQADRKAQASGFLSGSALEASASDPAWRFEPGAAFGPYQLERPLGAGGMGEVWLARRADGLYEGFVALKLLHPHLASASVRSRFAREGRILARLSHPNIARLLDAGAAAGGPLYLVLEYVEGSPLDRWCDERRLDLAARLREFLQVCEAVAHAHAHLVVHRDLKPSNILVTGDGAIKLLDFGIAKLIEAEESATPATEITQLGGRALTPEFAAPEQLRGEPVTTATDVYALGVVLFNLLCGRRPYGTDPLTPAQLEHAVLEVEPPRMSQALGGAGAAELADARRVPASRLRRELRGDLDTIVAKALKKPPAERYPSALALAEDLRRYLNHEPVLAQPESVAYRARKFLRRHRVGAAAAAAILLSMGAGVAGVLWQAREARLQRDVAVSEANRNEAVREAMLHLFRVAGEQRGAGTMTARQMFDASAEQVLEDYRDDPDTAAGVLFNLGRLHEALNDDQAAEALFERVIAVRPADGALLTEARWMLAVVRTRQGRFEEARDLLAQVSSFFAQDARRYREKIPGLRRDQARLAGMTGDHAREREILETTIAEVLTDPAPDDTELAFLYGALATAHYRANDVAGAYAIQQKALAAWDRATGGRGNEALIAKGNQATNALRLGRLAEAEQRFRAVIAERREQFGESALLAGALNNYGAVLALLDRYEEALKVLDESLPMAAREAGENQIVTLNARLQIARARLLAGRPRDAVEALTPALATADAGFGPRHPFSGAIRHTLGAGRLALGDLDRADALISEAVASLRQSGAGGAHFLARALLDQSRLRQAQKRRGEAVACAEESVRLREKLVPPGSWEIAEARAELGVALRRAGDTQRGLRQLREAVDALRTQLGDAHSLTRRYVASLAP
jgi:serine/threonine protein kinase